MCLACVRESSQRTPLGIAVILSGLRKCEEARRPHMHSSKGALRCGAERSGETHSLVQSCITRTRGRVPRLILTTVS